MELHRVDDVRLLHAGLPTLLLHLWEKELQILNVVFATWGATE
jgi:hypothetical protein